MKKFLTLFLISTCSLLAFAQDVIITKDKEQIQAKVLEVSKDEIKYKKFNYQDGPSYIIDVDEILTIAYENGDVEVYDKDFIEEKNEIIQTKAEALLMKEAKYGTFVKEDGFYYLNSNTGSTRMDKEAYFNFIMNNCPEAYNSYQKGNRLWKAGLGLLGGGLGAMLLIGTPLYVVGLSSVYYDDYDYAGVNCLIAGAVFISVGSIATTGSIPLLIVGGIKRNNSHEVYNDRCKRTEDLTFTVNAKANGIGLALNF